MTKFVSVSSEDLTSGTASNFVFRLANPIENVRRFKIEQVIIPSTWYTVMSGINDKIYIYSGSTLYTATLTEGVYSATSLATEAQTQINSAYTPDNNFTVTLDTLTYKFTITHSATAFIVQFATNTTASARKLLGFNATDTSSATSHEADNVYDLGHSNTVNIVSSNLGGVHGRIGQTKNKAIFSMPANANFGTYLIYQSGHGDWVVDFSRPESFHELDFKLVFDDGSTEVPLNGVPWRIVLLWE